MTAIEQPASPSSEKSPLEKSVDGKPEQAGQLEDLAKNEALKPSVFGEGSGPNGEASEADTPVHPG